MSRETDSPSTGPQGRSDAPYPPGTPPFPIQDGRRADASATPGAPGPLSPDAEDGPRTETTLTTRVRINIPGSRPIPPVVMRTSVEGGGAEPPAGSGAQGAPPAREALPVREARPVREAASAGPPSSGASAEGGEEKVSEWFSPRKPSAPQEPGAASAQPPAPAAPPQAAPPVRDAVPPPPAGPPVRDALPVRDAAAPAPAESTAQLPAVRTDGHGFAAGDPANASPVRDTPPVPPGRPAGRAPGGSTAGPVTGSFKLAPPADEAPPAGPPGPAARTTRPGSAPASTGGAPSTGASGTIHAPAPPQMGNPFPSAPQPSAPQPSSPFAREAMDTPGFMQPPGGHMAPPVPPAGPGAVRDTGGQAYRFDAAPPEEARQPRRGRRGPDPKKLAALAGGGVFALLAVAYGAGLVLNHSDVPNGTTVLGVDIGGSTRDEAVSTLDAELQGRLTAPMKLRVGDTERTLKPQAAGLEMDTAATVRAATGSDYNPVSVIGSLFGGSREVEPVMSDDKDKLRAALEDLSGTGAGARDGMIRFEAGRAVKVPGTASESVDVAKAMDVVQAAFDTRAEGGPNRVVVLPVGKQEPKVSDAEFERAMKNEAALFMSANVKVVAGGTSIEFSPQRSLPKFLSLVPTPEGKLAPYVDTKALAGLYGSTFDGLTVERADGSRTPVQPTDVAQAVMAALQQTDPAKRVGTIEVAG
ncbi:hypothetical protein ACFQLX_17785 [Streptomyces polyrhachis]|uniref:Peptidoglycan binding domain-containing protein n=1 Tax=Streptomyces polyrhachis TaxID=1282885 RepID=A0ABW2GGV0_9ACTN